MWMMTRRMTRMMTRRMTRTRTRRMTRMILTLTSSMTSGTQPPKTNILVPIMVAEWRERGRGAIPASWGLLQVIVSGGGGELLG